MIALLGVDRHDEVSESCLILAKRSETERESRHGRKAVDLLSPLFAERARLGVPFFVAYSQRALMWRQSSTRLAPNFPEISCIVLSPDLCQA